MRKIFLLIIITVLFGTNNAFSADWYGPFITAISVGNCPYSGRVSHNSNIAPSPNNSYSLNSNQTNAAAAGSTMPCLRRDNTSPTLGTSGVPSGWTNQSVTATITCTDLGYNALTDGGSGCSGSQYSVDGGLWQNGASHIFDTIIGTNLIATIQFRSKDIADNPYSYSSVIDIKIDKILPTLLNTTITSSLSGSIYHVANDTETIIITATDISGGSPINIVRSEIENYNNPINTLTIPQGASPLTRTVNISIIDGIDKTNENYRDYTHNITEVCDEAGNCTSDIKDFTYHIYADIVDPGNSYVTGADNFVDKVADGSGQTLTVHLKDQFGNNIVPVEQSGGIFQERTVDILGTFTHLLDSNQFDSSGNGIKVTDFDGDDFTFANTSKSTTIIDINNNDGQYDLKFQVYSPTQSGSATDGRQYVSGSFSIDNISVEVEPISGFTNITDTNLPLSFQFKPLYYTQHLGDINDNGFIEGGFQTGSLDIKLATGAIVTGVLDSNKLHYIKTGTEENSFTASGILSPGFSGDIFNLSLGTNFISGAFDTLNSYIISLLFILDDISKFRDDIKKLQLDEYISYTLDGVDVTYKSNILNQNNSQVFETLKILGITNINTDKQKDLIENQDEEYIQNLDGEIIKANLKRDIRMNAINVIKVVSTSNGSNTISNLSGNIWESSNDGKKLGDILYFGDLNGENIVLDDNINNFEGRKTIIVRGGNLYIKSNIINNSSSDILGIIVLKDNAGNGGKLYIDTNVQKIDAVIYTDKSIMSYNEIYDNGDSDDIIKNEVDLNIDIGIMQNQLYILGTIFSENTIGGSRLDPPVCPFWTESVSGLICDNIEAQKYDLNYMRAGFETKYDSNYGDYPIIIKYNSAIQTTPPPLFSD